MNLKVDDRFTEEELKKLEALSKELGFTLTRTQSVVPETKIIKGIITCSLCKTVTVQYIQMVKCSAGTWKRDKDLTEVSGEPIPEENIHTSSARCCWNCRNILMEKNKSELVEMIMKLYSPVPAQQDVWKHVKELRELKKTEVKDE